jgi:hypothetical protein
MLEAQLPSHPVSALVQLLRNAVVPLPASRNHQHLKWMSLSPSGGFEDREIG